MTLQRITFCLMMFTSFAGTSKPLIEVFLTDEVNILNTNVAINRGYQVAVYNLDDGVRFNRTLSKGLSNNPVVAEQQAKQIAGNIDINGLKNAFIPVVKASFYELKKQPAIVFNNGETVIYGITDLSVAIAMQRKWEAQN